jgi:hypothetical protein
MSDGTVTFLARGDIASNWVAANPVLHICEFGVEEDTRRFKIGTGLVAWNSLPYATAFVPDGDYGDITVSSVGSNWAIDAGAITLAKQADVGTGTVFYRKTAGTGAPEVQTLATLKTDLGLTGTNSGDQTSIVGITGTKTQFNTACTDGDFIYSGDAAALAQVTASGGIQATGNRAYAGSGIGMYFDGTTCFLQAYNHPGTAYLPLTINGLTITFGPNGTSTMVLSQTGTVFNTTAYFPQGSGNSINATATLTIAQMLASLIFCNSAVAVSYTLPTGTLTDAGVMPGLANDRAFDWFILNIGSAAGAITMIGGTNHTYIGNTTIAIGDAAQFRTRKTAANTYITYRIG